MRIQGCFSHWVGMETPTLLLAATSLLAIIVGPRLIQIGRLINRTRKYFEDGHERAAIRERNWYRRVDDKPSAHRSTPRA
jgi:hypothetical protein